MHAFLGLASHPPPASRCRRHADSIDAVCVKASGLWTLLRHWIGKERLSGHMATLCLPADPAPKPDVRA